MRCNGAEASPRGRGHAAPLAKRRWAAVSSQASPDRCRGNRTAGSRGQCNNCADQSTAGTSPDKSSTGSHHAPRRPHRASVHSCCECGNEKHAAQAPAIQPWSVRRSFRPMGSMLQVLARTGTSVRDGKHVPPEAWRLAAVSRNLHRPSTACAVLWDVYGECTNFAVLSGHKNALLQLCWGAAST